MHTKNFSNLLWILWVGFSFLSCSNEEATSGTNNNIAIYSNVTYKYTTEELEVLNLVNNYRASKGLNTLGKLDIISTVSEGHDNYMIAIGQISHNNFADRHQALVNGAGAKTVSENLAYNFTSPQGVVNAWIASEGHRHNMEGDFTHFGIAIRENSQGKKYYTNIFIKK